MSLRSLILVAALLAFLLALNVNAAGAARDRKPPTAPTNLRITATGPTSISLAWNPSTDNSNNWWYCLQRDGGGCIRIDPPKTTFSNSRLWPGATYNYSVYAVDAAGNRSASSNTVTYKTPRDVTPPTAPTLATTGLWPTRVALSWSASTDNATQVFYTLFVDGAVYFGSQIGQQDSTVLDLQPSTRHVFGVRASDAFGNVSDSDVLTVTTPAVTDHVAPSVPANFHLTSESTPPEAWLDWNDSTDNGDPQSLLMYEVFVNGELASRSIGYSSTIVYCVDVGPNHLVVRSVDTSGNASAFGNEIVFNC